MRLLDRSCGGWNDENRTADDATRSLETLSKNAALKAPRPRTHDDQTILLFDCAVGEALGQKPIPDPSVGVIAQRRGLADTVNSNDVRKAAGSTRCHAGWGILEDCGMPGGDAQRACRGNERVWTGLSLQMLTLGDDTVDALIEQILDTGGDQHFATVVCSTKRLPDPIRLPGPRERTALRGLRQHAV